MLYTLKRNILLLFFNGEIKKGRLNMNIERLYPEKVFHYFAEISKIPRASKKEKQISDWLVKFAKERKLRVIQDEHNNVIRDTWIWCGKKTKIQNLTFPHRVLS